MIARHSTSGYYACADVDAETKQKAHNDPRGTDKAVGLFAATTGIVGL
jgi:hypothetical protein